MRIAAAVIAICWSLLGASGVRAEGGAVLGLAAPLSGANAPLGLQMAAGFNAARGDAAFEIVDDACTAEAGRAAAEGLAARNVSIVVGFLCTEAIEAAMPVLAKAGIPVITAGVRTDSLTDNRDRTGWPVWRIAPRADAEAAAVATILSERWREAFFAIVDDGTIYGRELAETFRIEAESRGLKPVFVDTYRPQLDNQIGLAGRLKRAGATTVFVGGERDDAAILARDAAGLGMTIEVAGGEALRASGDVPIPDGVLMIALPDWPALATPGTVEAYRTAGVEPEGYVLPTHAATEIARQAIAAARDAEVPLATVLTGRTFRTVIGAIRFDQNGDLADNPYRLFRSDSGSFVPVAAP